MDSKVGWPPTRTPAVELLFFYQELNYFHFLSSWTIFIFSDQLVVNFKCLPLAALVLCYKEPSIWILIASVCTKPVVNLKHVPPFCPSGHWLLRNGLFIEQKSYFRDLFFGTLLFRKNLLWNFMTLYLWQFSYGVPLLSPSIMTVCLFTYYLENKVCRNKRLKYMLSLVWELDDLDSSIASAATGTIVCMQT